MELLKDKHTHAPPPCVWGGGPFVYAKLPGHSKTSAKLIYAMRHAASLRSLPASAYTHRIRQKSILLGNRGLLA